MQNVTDEVSNPFGMRPPCPCRCTPESDRTAVFGYGDANADFHVIGDHPGVHGGTETGVPFTGTESGERLLNALESASALDRTTSDTSGIEKIENWFLSYLYLCCVSEGAGPTPEQYADFERFFDAELRAISAHVLLPVGERAIEHVIETYTAKAHRLDTDPATLHASEIQGRGFLVVPIRDPARWDDSDRTALLDRLDALRARDYRQTADLGRFSPTSDPYFVR